jgi:choline dehydrogenase
VLDQQRATGVRYRLGGAEHRVRADGEVILSAGAVNSPKLLELSGIGDPDVLAAHGIELRHALAGVGRNLQDHLQIRTVFRVSGARTLNQLANSLTGKAAMAVEYGLFRSGPLSMAPSQLGIFSRSDDTVATPDLEYHVQPLSTDKLGDPLHRFPAVTVSVCNLRPQSRGSCHIRSRDPAEQPAIQLNYLSAEHDREVAIRAIRQVRRLVAAQALRRYSPEELLPGPAVVAREDMLAAIGNIATTIFHPVGTCRMGSDRLAVVDDRLRVHGLDGLRIVDASVMPTITSGNTASPVVMIAERAADLVRGDARPVAVGARLA